MTTTKAQQTAAAVYTERKAECQELIGRIEAQLKAHAHGQAADAGNWGYPGDLGRVTEELAYVLASLGDRSAVDAKGLEY